MRSTASSAAKQAGIISKGKGKATRGSGSPVASTPSDAATVYMEYEVFGKVQHVCMRKHTVQMATTLGLGGWVENTAAGTVRGGACGAAPAINRFKEWLEKEGAPKARPVRAEFTAEREMDATEAQLFPTGFQLRKALLPNGKQWAD